MTHGRHARLTLAEAIEHADEVARTTECPDCAADHHQLAMWLRMIVAARSASTRDRERRKTVEPGTPEPVERRESARLLAPTPEEEVAPQSEPARDMLWCACGRMQVLAGEWRAVDASAPEGNRVHRPPPLLCDYKCKECGTVNPLRHYPHWRD